MSLSSTSTLADALNQYEDNLSWEGSPEKAVLALEAIRFILLHRASQIQHHDGRRISYESLLDEKRRLEAYVERAGTAATSGRASFVRARGIPI